MKTKIIIGLILAAVAAVIFFIVRKKKHAKEIPPSTPVSRLNAQLNPFGNNSFPLKLGSKGSNVKALQANLNEMTGSNLAEDGIFGPQTEKAVNDYFKSKSVSTVQHDTLMKAAYTKINNKVLQYTVPGSSLLKPDNLSNSLMFGSN
jgi:peptidoglycan hydrolase-like protein with peptidoglycan-binding domain